MSNLNTFVQNLAGGGARANQYEIQITGSPVPNGTFSFLCRSAQIPGMTVGEVPVAYRGRQIFVAGDRTYDAWTVTVFSDTAWSVRKGFETWSDQIAKMDEKVTGATAPNLYYATALVQQFDRAGGEKAMYELKDVWPTTVDPIDLAYDTNDAVMEFGVTLRFNYMTYGEGGAAAPATGPHG
jgi:hypothetical protein